MEKIELTEEKLNELKKQTKDKFAYLLIEDLKGRLSSKKYKEAYKQLAFDRILQFLVLFPLKHLTLLMPLSSLL